MSLSTIASQLTTEWQTLRQRWEDATTVWADPVQVAFERDHIMPLEEQHFAVENNMTRLADVIAQARQNVK